MPVAPRMSPSLLIATILLAIAILPGAAVGQSTPDASPPASPAVDTGPRFVLRPAGDVDGTYFTVEAEPGTTQILDVVLGNADDVPLTLSTYAADAFTLVNGGFGTREEGEQRTGPSTWLTYESETLTLEPGSGLEREFALTVPDDAAPGEYIAGLVLQTAEPIDVVGSAMFDQIVRKSIAVFITVPGETAAGLELGEPTIQTSDAGERLVIPVRNTGDVLLKLAGELTLTDDGGTEIFSQPIVMGSVYAGTETTLELPLPLALPEAVYRVSLRLTDETTDVEAGVDSTEVALARADDSGPPVAITAASITPLPNADEVQFALVAITVQNSASPVAGARVLLNVLRDGEPVEDFLLATAVTLQQGETPLEQRYIPVTGWTTGEWTFSLTLESVDPQTGATTVMLTTEMDQSITVSDS